MEGLIIYISKYGSTRQYANWLANELDIPVVAENQATEEQLLTAEYLVIGTSVFYGRLRIKKWLRKNEEKIRNKKLFLFIVNAAEPAEESKRTKFVRDSVPDEIRAQCEVFFLPGRLIYDRISLVGRVVDKIAKRALKNSVTTKTTPDNDEVKSRHLDDLKDAINAFRGRNAALPINEIS
jgi:menaquinone-dependent protoporphyrinogen IX oxidase